jgi:hypothetical protein
MKRMLFMLAFMVATVLHVNAMDYETSRREALFLTDKMAYELNLNEVQYEQAYQINFDYLMGLGSPADAYGVYLSRRNMDFQYILMDWQYSLFTAADYFFRPVTWRLGAWFFPIYSIYDTARFFFSKPSCWLSYRGGHSWGHNGGNSWFRGRRAAWNGGFRGSEFRGGNAQHGGLGYHIGNPQGGVPGAGMQGGRTGNGRGYTIGEPNRSGNNRSGNNRGTDNRGGNNRNNNQSGYGNQVNSGNQVNYGNSGNQGGDNRGGRQSSTRSTVQGTSNSGNRSSNMGGGMSSGRFGGTTNSGRSGGMSGGMSSGGRSGMSSSGRSGNTGGGGRSGGGRR